jgi:hypothetical protein
MSINCRTGAKNGSEFILKALDKCAYEQCVAIGFSLARSQARQGKARQLDNAKNESFNERFGEESLYAVSEQQKTRKANSHAGFRVLNRSEPDLIKPSWTSACERMVGAERLELPTYAL